MKKDMNLEEKRRMRAEFFAWVRDQGCDTDGAWSAWQGAWDYREAERKKLLAVVKAAKYVALSNGFDAALPGKMNALRAALQDLGGEASQ